MWRCTHTHQGSVSLMMYVHMYQPPSNSDRQWNVEKRHYFHPMPETEYPSNQDIDNSRFLSA